MCRRGRVSNYCVGRVTSLREQLCRDSSCGRHRGQQVAREPRELGLRSLRGAGDPRRTSSLDTASSYVVGKGDRCRWTIIQSDPRLVTTKVTRPVLAVGCPSFTLVMVSNPAMTTVLSSTTSASELLSLAVRGLSVFRATSKYFRICSGVAITALPKVPIIKASGA